MSERRYFLRGDVDLDAAPRVLSELRELIAGSDAHLLIDCAHLTFIDSSGVAALLEAHRDLAERGRYLLIVNVPRGPMRVFEVLGLGDLLRYERETA